MYECNVKCRRIITDFVLVSYREEFPLFTLTTIQAIYQQYLTQTLPSYTHLFGIQYHTGKIFFKTCQRTHGKIWGKKGEKNDNVLCLNFGGLIGILPEFLHTSLFLSRELSYKVSKSVTCLFDNT